MKRGGGSSGCGVLKDRITEEDWEELVKHWLKTHQMALPLYLLGPMTDSSRPYSAAIALQLHFSFHLVK